MVYGNPSGEGLRQYDSLVRGHFLLHLRDKHEIQTGALVPMYWHDSGIPAPNAAVLIAVFALRLSAGGLSVMFARSDGQKGRREKETSTGCQDGIFKGLYRVLQILSPLMKCKHRSVA